MDEVSKRIGLSKRTLQERIKNGELVKAKNNRPILISYKNLKNYVDKLNGKVELKKKINRMKAMKKRGIV